MSVDILFLNPRYLNEFLEVKDSFPAGHKLLGRIEEGQGRLDKAIKCFQRSLQLDNHQNDVLIKSECWHLIREIKGLVLHWLGAYIDC